MANELENKGKEIRTRLWGEQGFKRGDEFLKKFDEGFAKFLNEQLFGEIWNRPGLPTKARSMITVAVLMALGRGEELRLHMRGALHLGITPEELKEIIVHVSQYSGVPTAIEGIRAFTEVTTPAK
ncbi:MAG: carboxymuconolactone decarboxylase family protein [Candidatus Binataceae bacterium]